MVTNIDTYSSKRTVMRYSGFCAEGLTAQEQKCLSLVPAKQRNSVLDIGIGTGRTTASLTAFFATYVGIDYSSEMVLAAKKRFPDADIRVLDARKLNLPQPFDCIVFSFNGIDSVDYHDRLEILKAVVSQLSGGGHFIYSTHNIHYKRVAVWRRRFFVRELIPSSVNRHAIYRLIGNITGRLRNFIRQGLETNSIAYINDPGDAFHLINTYVDIPEEIARLNELGLTVITTIGNTKNVPGFSSDDNWVYIVCQKKLEFGSHPGFDQSDSEKA